MVRFQSNELNPFRRDINARYVLRGALALILFMLTAPTASPEALSSPLSTLQHILFNPQIDRAGNSTGILMASALVSLMWFRTGRSAAVVFTLLTLGVMAGAGA